MAGKHLPGVVVLFHLPERAGGVTGGDEAALYAQLQATDAAKQ